MDVQNLIELTFISRYKLVRYSLILYVSIGIFPILVQPII